MTTPAPPNLPHWLNKVPEATLLFWIIKMMSTTVGETAADYLNFNLHLGLGGTSIVTGLLLALALWGQLRSQRYSPPRYWLVVVLVSVFGTLITDNLSDVLGVPLAVSTALFSGALLATFAIWWRAERTLAISTVNTPRREWFYWTAILFTFALGTAAGDWVAEGINLGYGNSALLFGGVIAAVAAARFAFEVDATLCFWLAYVLTHPLGASCGDLLSQPVENGGLGLGTVGTTAGFLLTIIALVAMLTIAARRARSAVAESA
jgi:uncharacterized membrane-anchored protein